MKIKTRLSIYFTLISCGALLLVLLAVYFSVFTYFRIDFNQRLADRVELAAKLYLEADEVGPQELDSVQRKYLERLPDEVVRIYNERNKAAFDASNGIYWTDAIIEQVRKNGSIEYEEGDRQVVGKHVVDNQGNFVILASAVDRSFHRRLTTIAYLTLIVFICFSGVLFFAGQWFAKKALSPIKSIIDQMHQIGSRNLHKRIDDVKNKDEIAELISNFNYLLERLENAFELQQSFVANASHELRTPLTSIMGEADVALEKKRTTEEYEQILRSISADAMRLREIISSLMELAQVDFNYTLTELAPVRVDELIWELDDIWAARKAPGMLKISFTELPEDENELVIPANKALLDIAINNIIDNAFKYSDGQPVLLNFRVTHNTISIAITDAGPGISEDEAKNIFKPFYRVKRTQSVQGSGVGLYIAGKIIALFKGTIKVESDGSSGSSFIISFPTSQLKF
ncbi:sensor histidine kinase [Mucilaginibacter auburnensis]|uniref:histidine kinase n=1 Tax=Mucilaginibacter auburnensis TaxID=1457233 RepID=A0A2H9VQI0_9SPHI|nr:ATP-binding protein [Mucilaginibacter auburnensis]PJJ83081.1 signal transduction histidine kinase [Mucilaginibacter auburnensis]